ncbi:MAG: hypothetical protein JO182_23115, partial [Acidobacteriaceae bacterium]|nr:hypothetical protein [Acidobacteriaceae bacterium]
RFVGDRASAIDQAFDIALRLSPTMDSYSSGEQGIDPHRVLLSFRVARTICWVNLTPALELLHKDHELLPTVFYHSLERSLSRWFRVFDLHEARWRWDEWADSREEQEEERKFYCEQHGVPYVPLQEPQWPTLVDSKLLPFSESAVSQPESETAGVTFSWP